jgi:hypothetical protein
VGQLPMCHLANEISVGKLQISRNNVCILPTDVQHCTTGSKVITCSMSLIPNSRGHLPNA